MSGTSKFLIALSTSPCKLSSTTLRLVSTLAFISSLCSDDDLFFLESVVLILSLDACILVLNLLNSDTNALSICFIVDSRRAVLALLVFIISLTALVIIAPVYWLDCIIAAVSDTLEAALLPLAEALALTFILAFTFNAALSSLLMSLQALFTVDLASFIDWFKFELNLRMSMSNALFNDLLMSLDMLSNSLVTSLRICLAEVLATFPISLKPSLITLLLSAIIFLVALGPKTSLMSSEAFFSCLLSSLSSIPILICNSSRFIKTLLSWFIGR